MDKNICLKCNGHLHYLIRPSVAFEGFVCDIYWMKANRISPNDIEGCGYSLYTDDRGEVNYELDKSLKFIHWVNCYDDLSFKKRPFLLKWFPNIYLNNKLKHYTCFKECPYYLEHQLSEWNKK